MSTIAHIRRVVLGMSQHELARLCGVTQGTVSRWEIGHLSPHMEDLVAIRDEVSRRGLSWDDSWFFEQPSEAAQ